MNALRIAPLIAGAAGLIYASNAEAALVTYHVDTTADTFDPDGCIDREVGNCSLRSAVYEANKDAVWDEISLPAGNYVIDNAIEGVIDVTTGVHFTGDGPDLTTIESISTTRSFAISTTRPRSWAWMRACCCCRSSN
ncbi:MAG: hypothetical protein AAF799_20305 [Myxococcota bacterium]